MSWNADDFTLVDPEWYAHRYVESDDTFRFIRLRRDEHSRLPFLTDAHLGAERPTCDLPTAVCLDALDHGRMAFLFHSAFCGSTMLARAFDRPGLAMGLSEPVTLNDVFGYRLRRAQAAAVARAADAACRLLARPFASGETVVVKPSNVINPLAELLMALQDDAPAIFLYAPLSTFLISVARKGLECRLWVRELLEAYLHAGIIDLGFSPEDYFRQTDLQIAAVGWLAQHALFARMAVKFGPMRLRTLNADLMIADPVVALAAAAAHYRLHFAPEVLESIASGPVFHRHSKTGFRFAAATRTVEYAAANQAYGAEIDQVLIWAKAVAGAAGINLIAPNPLIG